MFMGEFVKRGGGGCTHEIIVSGKSNEDYEGKREQKLRKKQDIRPARLSSVDTIDYGGQRGDVQ